MCLGCRAGAAIVGMQMAFSPTLQDIEMIEQYRKVLVHTQQKQPEIIRILDEKLKYINTLQKSSTLKNKKSWYADQIKTILCDIEPHTCSKFIEQQL